MLSFIEQFKAVRRTSTPIVAICTPDPAQTIESIKRVSAPMPVILVQDIVRGVVPHSDAGADVLRKLMAGPPPITPEQLRSPVTTMNKAHLLPNGSILVILNAHLLMNDPAVVQAIWNLRDVFKADYRTLVLLGPSFKLPSAIAHDVTILNEPWPTPEQLAQIVKDTYEATGLPPASDKVLAQCKDAMCGLSAFEAEQASALSILPNGMDVSALWERKRQMIAATGFLAVYSGTEKLCDVKGVQNLVGFLSTTMDGEEKPAVVVFMDEIEKTFAGMGNSQDSITKEQVGKFLTWTEKRNSQGKVRIFAVLLLGPAGTGKSMIAKALGNEFEKPTIIADFSSMKDSLVGQSQHNTDEAFKVIDAVAGDRPILLIATCNDLNVLPPEVRSRFSYGTFYVDLPDAEAGKALWKQYKAEYGLTEKDIPPSENWTGREIRNCCDIAKQNKLPLKDAAQFIVPTAKTSAQIIAQLRAEAHNRFISASKTGVYKDPGALSDQAFAQETTIKRAIRTTN